MRWLKNLFKKTKVGQINKPKEKQIVSFDKISDFLEEETKEKKAEFDSKIKEFRSLFIDYLRRLNKEFTELETAKFDRIILEDKRDISNIIKTSRKNYCYNSKKMFVLALDSLQKESNPYQMKSIISELFDRLNKFSRDAQILLNPFQKQMKKISSDLKKLRKELDDFDLFLTGEYSLIQKEKKARELLTKITKYRLDNKQKEEKKKEIDENIEKLKKEIKEQNSKILKIQNSNEAREIRNLEKKQISLEKQIEDIISDTTYSVNSISRQIREYLYIANKEERAGIKAFLENPEILLGREQRFFEEIAKKVKNNIKKIESNERKRKKFLEIEKGVVLSLNKNKGEYKIISDRLRENIRKIKKLKQEITTEKEEQEIAKLREQIQHLEKNKKELESEEVNRKGLLGDLEKILSDISGKEIRTK